MLRTRILGYCRMRHSTRKWYCSPGCARICKALCISLKDCSVSCGPMLLILGLHGLTILAVVGFIDEAIY
jgi:hypothetical protein